MRLFVALELPEQIRQEISEKLLALIPRETFRPVERQNLHFTLLFIGEAGEQKAAEIIGKFSGIHFGEFPVEISGAGSFGGRVVWLGAGKGAGEMEKLAKTLSEKLGIAQEGLSCHLTLARCRRKGGRGAEKLAERLSKINFTAGFNVDSCALMRPGPVGSGLAYEKVCEVKFGSGKRA